MLVQRLEGRDGGARRRTARPAAAAEPERRPHDRSRRRTADPQEARPARRPQSRSSGLAWPAKTIEPVSPTLMAGDSPLPGDGALRLPSGTRPRASRATTTRFRRAAHGRGRTAVSGTPPGDATPLRDRAAIAQAAPTIFRTLEKGLMEIDFSRQGLHQAGHDLLVQRQPDVLGQGQAARRPCLARDRDRYRAADPDRPGARADLHARDRRARLRRALAPGGVRGERCSPATSAIGDEGTGARGGGARRARDGGALRREQAAAARRSRPACRCRCRRTR